MAAPVILLDVPPTPACLVLGLPHLATRLEDESVLLGLSPAWARLTAKSKPFLISPCEPGVPTPESAWLGLDPSQWRIGQGPLTIAALGRTPPERAICFHLSLLGLDSEERLIEVDDLSDSDAEEAISLLLPLQTKRITLLPGVGTHHGMVWERGPRELATSPWPGARGALLTDSLPSGEEEDTLRGFITDARCILDGAEVNRRRRGEGLAPVAIAYPWGEGEGFQAPNLPLRRGAVLRIFSRSMRMLGLARLFGEWHGPLNRIGGENWVDWKALRIEMEGSDPVLAMIHPIPALQEAENLEILEALLDQLFREIVEPFLAQDRPLRLTILASGDPYNGKLPASRCSPLGLGLNFDSRRSTSNTLPFDERLFEEPRVPRYPLHEAAQRAVFDPYR